MSEPHWIAAPGATPPEGARLLYLPRPDGARLRCAVLPHTSPRGVAVVTTGYNEFIEKYFEVSEALRDRGFAVVLYDTRGQGLSSRPLDDASLAHATSFDIYADDLAAMASEIAADLAPNAPLILLAHSMGGLVTLHALATGRARPAAAALSAPMTRVVKSPPALFAAEVLTGLLCAIGLGEKPIFGRGPFADEFEDNPFTHDRARFESFKALQAVAPIAVLRGPTNAWVRAAIKAGNALSDGLKSVRTPMLIASAGDERVIDGTDHARVAQAAPNCSLLPIPGARHEILVEADDYRRQFWDAFDELAGRAGLAG